MSTKTPGQPYAQDVAHLIYLDLQFGWRGETDLKLPELERLEARGWIAEGQENGEFDITDDGHKVIDAHLRQHEASKAGVTEMISDIPIVGWVGMLVRESDELDYDMSFKWGDFEPSDWKAANGYRWECKAVIGRDKAIAALEAVAPMLTLAGGRVPEAMRVPHLGPDQDADDGFIYAQGKADGWNACCETMLAAATKPGKEGE